MTIAGSGREREREARVGGDDHREEGVHIYIVGVLFWTDFCLEVREGSWDMKRKQPDQREKTVEGYKWVFKTAEESHT